jgi:hypothetical protein
VGEVLSVNAESAVEVAKKNAALNGITSCRYFGGKAEDILPVVTKEQRYDKVCAVVTCCINRSYASKFSSNTFCNRRNFCVSAVNTKVEIYFLYSHTF